MTDRRFSAILFDCDGVLVDSEPITVGVLHAMLGEMGWDLPLEECIRRFVGKAFKDEAHVIHEHTGYLIDDAWIALRVSNAILLGLLFFAGFRWARHTVLPPLRTGLLFLAAGVALVAVAIALGG